MKRLLLSLGLLGLLTAPAQAALVLSASFDGTVVVTGQDQVFVGTCTNPITISCTLADVNPSVGILETASNSFSNVQFLSTVQTQDIATIPGTINRLDSTGTQVTNNDTVSHIIAIAVGATDFQGPVLTATTTGAGQWSTLNGLYGDTGISMTWWNDPANGQGALVPGIPQPGNLIDIFNNVPTAGVNPQSFSHNGGPFAVNDPDLFSMTIQLQSTIATGVRLTKREMTEIKPLAIPAATPFTLIVSAIKALLG
jgi:hypothetical protein